MSACDGYYELSFQQIRNRVESMFRLVQTTELSMTAQRELAAIAWALVGRIECSVQPVVVKDHGSSWWSERSK